MKRPLRISIAVLLLCCLLVIPAPAEGATMPPETSDSSETAPEATTTPTTVEWSVGDLTNDDDTPSFSVIGDWGMNAMWHALTSSNETYFWMNTTGVVQVLYGLSLPIGFLVLLVGYALRLKKTNMHMESRQSILYSIQPLFGTVLVMVLSYYGMTLITNTFNMLPRLIMRGSNLSLSTQIQAMETKIDNFANNIPIVGVFYQIFYYCRYNKYYLAVNLFYYVDSLLVGVVLGIRHVKLALYTGTAPMFLGSFGNEGSKSVGRNFILQYLQTVFQVMSLSAVFAVFQATFNGFFLSGIAVEGRHYGMIILLIVLGVCTLTCHRWFDRAFH